MSHRPNRSVVFLFGGAASFTAAWVLAATTKPADGQPPPNRSGVVTWKEATTHKAEWGEMRYFFRGESHGTRDVLVATAVVEPGKAVHRAHRHAEEEYLILSQGTGTWHLAGKEFPASKGDCLHVEPWVFHGLTNTGTEPLVFTVVRYSPKGLPSPPRPDDGKDEK
ncbi:MAG: cupin domain-containing protein [Planctomycetes bacterium]|nr:cupin domain-containing protein [Planctomycetota bacterium]